MFCPSCQTEYLDGFHECADCRVPLVHELPRTEDVPSEVAPLAPPPGAELVAVFECEDVYAFLAAADALRRAGIPFAGAENYTGEFRPHKRAQAPYVRTLLVEPELEEEALKALATLAGET